MIFSAFSTISVELIWFNIFNPVLVLTPFKLIIKLSIAFFGHLKSSISFFLILNGNPFINENITVSIISQQIKYS